MTWTASSAIPAWTAGKASARFSQNHSPTREKAPRGHVVKRGETLSSIARQHGLDPEALRRANANVNPKKLRPGQTLALPGDDGP